jgi:VWFA-related protein
VKPTAVAMLFLFLGGVQTPRGEREAARTSPSTPDDAKPVRISVVVTDRAGRPVAGLTPKDFELRDDDQVQHLDSVEQRTPQPRRLAVLLDEFHVSETAAVRMREVLTTFVDHELRPDDLVVVFKPLDSLPSIRLTNDRAEIRAAIASFEGRAGTYEPRTALEEQTVGRSPVMAESARAQIVLSAMRALTARLGGVAGRAAILLVSEGFVPIAREMQARALPDLGIVERSANRYDVPVYVCDPSAEAPSDAVDEPQVMLRRVVQETGGAFFPATDITTGLKLMNRDLDGGYVLAYRPAHGEDGKFHTIKVRALRRDAEARARAGYVSPPSAEMRRAMRASVVSEPMRMLKRSSFIDVWAGVTRAVDTSGRVVVTWEPGRLPGSNAKSPAFSVTLKATTKEGKVLYDGTLAAMRSAIEGGGVPADRAEFDAPVGRVQLDMTILGERGEKLDIDARDLEVPNLKGPTPLVLLPPVVLATRSAREFRDVTADLNAAPSPLREFSRTERLLIRVPAYTTAGEDPRVTARLLNRVGQLMREIDPLPGEPQHGVTQFDLQLAPLAPGDYYLHVIATGTSGKVEQRIGFRITG